MAFGMASEVYGTVLGNHHPQYVDISIDYVLNLNTHDIGAPTARRLKSSDPKCVNKYVQSFMKNFISHNTFQRVEIL